MAKLQGAHRTGTCGGQSLTATRSAADQPNHRLTGNKPAFTLRPICCTCISPLPLPTLQPPRVLPHLARVRLKRRQSSKAVLLSRVTAAMNTDKMGPVLFELPGSVRTWHVNLALTLHFWQCQSCCPRPIFSGCTCSHHGPWNAMHSCAAASATASVRGVAEALPVAHHTPVLLSWHKDFHNDQT